MHAEWLWGKKMRSDNETKDLHLEDSSQTCSPWVKALLRILLCLETLSIHELNWIKSCRRRVRDKQRTWQQWSKMNTRKLWWWIRTVIGTVLNFFYKVFLWSLMVLVMFIWIDSVYCMCLCNADACCYLSAWQIPVADPQMKSYWLNYNL